MNLRKYPMDTQKCVLHIMSCKLTEFHCIAWFISNYGYYLRDYQNVYEFGSIKEFCVIVFFFNVEQIPTRKPMPSIPGSEVT